jgi:ribosomal protein S18 acetylase RimI-like enzyme
MGAPARPQGRSLAGPGVEAEARIQPPQPFEVRPATREDVPAISAMQKESLPETYGPFIGRAAVEEFVGGGNIDRYFEDHWRQATVATLGSEIIGVAVLLGGLLDLIWVKPSVRSKGIGSALIETVERQAAGHSSELTLEAWRLNEHAVDFYKGLGFAISDTVADPVTGLEKLVMRRTLRPGG